MTDLYKMNLHEKIFVESYEVLRVPGGWIYTTKEKKSAHVSEALTSVFVPMNSEFNWRDVSAYFHENTRR
jgi:hypothetical protein